MPSKIMSEAGRRVNVTRPLTHSLDCGEEGLAVNATRTCLINDCGSPARGRGLCVRHYDRARRSGTLDRYELIHEPIVSCSIDGCDKPRHTQRGLCSMHLSRLQRTGSVDIIRPRWRKGSAHYKWAGDDVGYGSVHCRLTTHRGRAAAHACVDCGGPGSQWSYVGDSPAEKSEQMPSGVVLVYSTDLNDYVPRCASCHRLYDNALARRRARDVARDVAGERT